MQAVFVGCLVNQEIRWLRFHSASLLLLSCFIKSEEIVDPPNVLVLCLCSLCFQNVGCLEPVIASLSSVQGLFSAYVPKEALETNTGAIIYIF